jgi:hypothetical protein
VQETKNVNFSRDMQVKKDGREKTETSPSMTWR